MIFIVMVLIISMEIIMIEKFFKNIIFMIKKKIKVECRDWKVWEDNDI